MVNQLIVGDCYSVLQTIDHNSIQLVVTSPPYPNQKICRLNVEQWVMWFEPIFIAIVNILDQNGVLVLNVMFPKKHGGFDYRLFSEIQKLGEKAALFPIDLYIWDKMNPVPCGNFKRNDIVGWEPVFVFGKSKNYKFYPVRSAYSNKTLGKLKEGNKTRAAGIDGSYIGGHNIAHSEGARQSNVLRISSSGDQNRPRALNGSFPLDLPKRFILQHTQIGDTVLDPFCGVGTTCYAAKKLNRNYIGIDMNAQEINKAEQWLAQLS